MKRCEISTPDNITLMNLSRAELQGIGSGSILRRKANGDCECVTDEVAREEPLEIRVDNAPLAVTMRTPGHDEELAAGFLVSEGIVRARSDLRRMNSLGNIVEVALSPAVKFDRSAAHRFGTISTSCGLCG